MAQNIKSIAYSLYENKLTDPDKGKKFTARIRAKGSVGEEDLVEMITLRNSTVTRQEVTAVLDLLQEVVKSSLQMGYNIHTEIFNTSLSIKGVFDSMTDEFDSERHKLVLNVKAPKSLKDFVTKDLALEKTGTTLPVPSLFSVYDYFSDEHNDHVTPGNTIALDGCYFQFDPDAAEQGLFFVNDVHPDGVKADRIVSCTSRKLVALVPETLADGEYNVEVRCGFGSVMRAAQLESSVTVLAA